MFLKFNFQADEDDYWSSSSETEDDEFEANETKATTLFETATTTDLEKDQQKNMEQKLDALTTNPPCQVVIEDYDAIQPAPAVEPTSELASDPAPEAELEKEVEEKYVPIYTKKKDSRNTPLVRRPSLMNVPRGKVAKVQQQFEGNHERLNNHQDERVYE